MDLGGRHNLKASVAEDDVNELLAGFQKRSKRVFELSWKGSKIPGGAVILGKEVGWTQNGMVTSVDGEMIGTYERLEEFGGAEGNDQRIRVYVTERGEGHDGN